MDVSGHIHAPPPVPNAREAGWASGRGGQEKNY